MITDPKNTLGQTEAEFLMLGHDIAAALPKWVDESLDLIGLEAQSNFINVDTSKTSNKLAMIMGAPTHPSKLTNRSGRFARSLAPGGGGFNPKTGQREGIQEVKVSGDVVTGKKGSKVPYANIHQHGGSIDQTQTVTDKQRGFFWAMYYQMDDDKYKAMALADTLTIHIDMPARPVLPDDAKAAALAEAHIKKQIGVMVRGRFEA